MNDNEVMTAVRESFAQVRLDQPLEQTIRRGRVLRGRSRTYRAAGVAGVAAIAGVTAVAITGLDHPAPIYSGITVFGSGTPLPTATAPANTGGGTRLDAWTVTKDPDGAVQVTIRQLGDAAGIQRALRADGVPARVAFQPGIPSDSPPLPAGCENVDMPIQQNVNLQSKIIGMMPDPLAGIALTIYPREIPKGIGIYLAVQPGVAENGGTEWGWGLDLVQATPACTG